MNLAEKLEADTVPWQPSSTARLIEVWHEYEIPLVGIFELDGQRILFKGHDYDEKHSTWSYLALDDRRVKELADRKFSSADELWGYVGQLFASAETYILVAAHDLQLKIGWNEPTPTS